MTPLFFVCLVVERDRLEINKDFGLKEIVRGCAHVKLPKASTRNIVVERDLPADSYAQTYGTCT